MKSLIHSQTTNFKFKTSADYELNICVTDLKRFCMTENIEGKGENTGNFLLFPQCFLSCKVFTTLLSQGRENQEFFGKELWSLFCVFVKGYQSGVKKIPTACITVEDAEMMWRMEQRGKGIHDLEAL